VISSIVALGLVIAAHAQAETVAADARVAPVKYVYKCGDRCPPGTVVRDHRGEGKTRILYCRFSGCRPGY
jgi:hypothetical protein